MRNNSNPYCLQERVSLTTFPKAHLSEILFFIVIFISFRSFVSTFFYVSWLSELAILILSIFWLMHSSLLVKRSALFAYLVSILWLVASLGLTPWAVDVVNHVKIWIVCFLYTTVSIVIYFRLMENDGRLVALLFFWLTVVWTGGSIILFAGWCVGVVNYGKIDFSGFFHDRNVYSIATLIVISFIQFYQFYLTKLQRKLVSVMILMCFFFVLVGKSVTGLMGVGILVYSYLKFIKKVRYPLFKGLMVLTTFLILATIVKAPIIKRLEKISYVVSGDMDKLYAGQSVFDRLYLIKAGWQLSKEHFITGVGLDNARNFVSRPGDEKKEGVFLHNTYLDILSSGGAITWVCYYSLLFIPAIFFLKRTGDLRHDHALTLFLLCSVFDFTWTNYFEFSTAFAKNYLFCLFVTTK